MPKLRRPDGVELYWEAQGEGPLVVLCHPCFSVRGAFDALAIELMRDHRVLAYDTRGTGDSTRRDPYDIATDIEDLLALLGDLGERAVLIGFADALHRSVEVGAARPDLVAAVVSPGVAALGAQRSYSRVGSGLASSPAVVDALLKLFESDYRSGLRTVVEGGNPQFNEQQVQERIDQVMRYTPIEATVGRLRSWIDTDSREAGRRLGDRFWVLVFGGNIWFPEQLTDSLRRELPEAHVEPIEDGAVSRPELTAAIIRRITRC